MAGLINEVNYDQMFSLQLLKIIELNYDTEWSLLSDH